MERLRRSVLTHTYGAWQDAPREPITIAISLFAYDAAFAVTASFAAAQFAASIAIPLVVTASLTGIQYALGKTKSQAGGIGFDGPSAINSPEARGSVRQSTAAQRKIYGRMLVGGAWGFYDDATPPYQYLQLWLARGRISAIRGLVINKNSIPLASTAWNTIVEPVAVDGQDYVGNLKCCFRQGTTTQAKDALLDLYFPASGSEFVFDSTGRNVVNLPSTYKQLGVATASFRANFGADRAAFEALWGQVPYINPLIEVDGAPVYDPRDPTQDRDDEDTWKFTYDGRDVGRTAALIQADWMRQPYGGRQSSDKIRWDEVAEAANFDESIVHDRDGSPRSRHLIDGLVQLNENPRYVTEAMLTANRAFIVQSRGRIGWVPSAPLDPIVTLTEKDLLGGLEFWMGTPKKDTFNRIRTRFTPPEKEFKEDDGPVLDRTDLRADEDGDELLETTVRTPFTADQRAVQWLAQQFLDESRLPKSLDIPAVRARPKFLKCKVGNVIRVQLRRYPDVNGIYQIRSDGFSGNFETLSWSLRQYDKTIASDDRSADQQDFQVATAT